MTDNKPALHAMCLLSQHLVGDPTHYLQPDPLHELVPAAREALNPPDDITQGRLFNALKPFDDLEV